MRQDKNLMSSLGEALREGGIGDSHGWASGKHQEGNKTTRKEERTMKRKIYR